MHRIFNLFDHRLGIGLAVAVATSVSNVAPNRTAGVSAAPPTIPLAVRVFTLSHVPKPDWQPPPQCPDDDTHRPYGEQESPKPLLGQAQTLLLLLLPQEPPGETFLG